MEFCNVVMTRHGKHMFLTGSKGKIDNSKKVWLFLARCFPDERYSHHFHNTAQNRVTYEGITVSKVVHTLHLTRTGKRVTRRNCPAWTFQAWEQIFPEKDKHQIEDLKNAVTKVL